MNGVSGTVYYYRVRACNPTTCGLFSSANTGHRGSMPGVQAGVGVANAALPVATPIPVLSEPFGRWLLILMILGFGLLLLKYRYGHIGIARDHHG